MIKPTLIDVSCGLSFRGNILENCGSNLKSVWVEKGGIKTTLARQPRRWLRWASLLSQGHEMFCLWYEGRVGFKPGRVKLGGCKTSVLVILVVCVVSACMRVSSSLQVLRDGVPEASGWIGQVEGSHWDRTRTGNQEKTLQICHLVSAAWAFCFISLYYFDFFIYSFILHCLENRSRPTQISTPHDDRL